MGQKKEDSLVKRLAVAMNSSAFVRHMQDTQPISESEEPDERIRGSMLRRVSSSAFIWR